MRKLRLLTCVAILSSCAPASTSGVAAPGAPTAASNDVIIAVANSLFSAMEARDTVTLRRIFLPDARLVSVRVRDGMDPSVRSAGVSDFVASVGRSAEVLQERMWNPQVLVNDDFASLWAPYDFHQDDRFTHCGVDAFHFVRVGSEWKIAALSYTVQTDSCPPSPFAR